MFLFDQLRAMGEGATKSVTNSGRMAAQRTAQNRNITTQRNYGTYSGSQKPVMSQYVPEKYQSYIPQRTNVSKSYQPSNSQWLFR